MAASIVIVCWLILGLASSHSWVERLLVIGRNGTMIGKPGYIRGAVRRTQSFRDLDMQHLLPLTPEGYLSNQMCKSTQTSRNYTSTLPALQAHPGDYIALQYQENGHVTLPNQTPQKSDSGYVYIYGTSNPDRSESLGSIHKVWNTNGTAGDRRGRLLATRKFDDGQCYQINNGSISRARQKKYGKTAINPQGADLWCQNDFRLPLDIARPSWYTIYWVWDWPSLPSVDLPGGKSEIYTSCVDIDVQAGVRFYGTSFVDGQDLNTAGIKEQLQ